MGIFKAGMAAFQGAAKDQWKEFFRCAEMDADTLMCRAIRQGGNGGSGNVITEGSVILVGEGECAIVTENGKVIGVYDQPGEQIYSGQHGQGVFTGGVRAFARDVGRRIAFGGDAPYVQRVFYFNTKELMGNAFSATNVPFRFKDGRAAVDLDGSLSCSGSYSFRIEDPALFYKTYARSAVDKSRRQLAKQLDAELLTALGPIVQAMLADGIRPSELPQYSTRFGELLTLKLCEEWGRLRGIEACCVAIDSLLTTDQAMVQTAQRDTAFIDPVRGAAHLVGAAGDAIQTAAGNHAGTAPAAMVMVGGDSPQSDAWKCSCGAENKGRFCTECGAARPTDWVCDCGQRNKGRFCTNCGKPKKI